MTLYIVAEQMNRKCRFTTFSPYPILSNSSR